MITVRCVETEEELTAALRLCYRLLAPELMETLPGERAQESRDAEHIYAYAAWKERMGKFSRLLLYAQEEGDIAAVVLGRPESAESLVCGMVACDEKFRWRGITKMLMERFSENARSMGFHYITLGADKDAEGFYEKCGFHPIFEIHGQKVYQRMLAQAAE
ncbi:MAG: GNAT family N-acetyltransferase [Lachnospiraceae bacterium]|nr:GNAT family N-acetyltransferase [Lachnospiraceae bacterium]